VFGRFSTSVSFRGAFRFASAGDLDAAVSAIQDLIDGETDDVATDLELHRKGCELRVRVETQCARDEYLVYETLIETLGTFASSGEVIGEIDDTITTYGAIVEQPSRLGTIAASAMAWLPLVFADDLLVLA
jgi:hypothetical protein